MFDDLATLFHENVVVTYQDYLKVRSTPSSGRNLDIKAALGVATALYHFREHLPPQLLLSWQTVVAACPDYALLGDVVNLSKHRTLTRGAPQILSVEDIEEQVVLTEYEDDRGPYRHKEKTVTLKLKDGSERELLDVMTNVLNYWLGELHRMGVLQQVSAYYTSAKAQPVPRGEADDGPLTLEAVQGLRFRQTFRLQRFNPQTGTTEPIDLTGHEARFRIYAPRHELDLELTHKESGEKLTASISLTGQESVSLARLETAEDQQRFLQSLPKVQRAFAELAEKAGLQRAKPLAPDDP